MNPKNTLIIFDIDGTLVESVSTYHRVVVQALNALGIKEIDTNFNALLHHTDSYALKYNYENYFGKTLPTELIDRFEDLLFEYLKQFPKTEAILGAKNIVDQLKHLGYAIAFATGSLPKTALLKLQDAEIWHDERVLSTSKNSFSREGFVLEAIDNAKTFYNTKSFETIIAMGDGIWDLKTAQSLNLNFIGIGKKNKAEMTKLGMTHWFEHFEDFELPNF